MQRIKSGSWFTIMLVISIFLVSCEHEIPGLNNNGNSTQTANCSADSVYFANEIQPLINSNCATIGCHDAATHKEGVELTSYQKIMGSVKPFNGANSELYKECVKTNNDRMPPAPMPALSSAETAKILKWINQGAFNNQCTGGCDTTLFTYSGAVSLINNTYCKGCHNPASLGGGIDLSTYAAIKVQVLNGKYLGSISHTAGLLAMPKGGSKLPDCQVTQVKKWILSGTLNN